MVHLLWGSLWLVSRRTLLLRCHSQWSLLDQVSTWTRDLRSTFWRCQLWPWGTGKSPRYSWQWWQRARQGQAQPQVLGLRHQHHHHHLLQPLSIQITRMWRSSCIACWLLCHWKLFWLHAVPFGALQDVYGQDLLPSSHWGTAAGRWTRCSQFWQPWNLMRKPIRKLQTPSSNWPIPHLRCQLLRNWDQRLCQGQPELFPALLSWVLRSTGQARGQFSHHPIKQGQATTCWSIQMHSSLVFIIGHDQIL